MDKTSCFDRHAVFAQGFHESVLTGGITANMTPREVSAQNPDFDNMDVMLYLNGAQDGSKNDRFRLELKCYYCGKGPGTPFVENA